MSRAAPPELAETGGTTGSVPLVLERRYWLLALIPLGVLVLVHLVLGATRREDVGFAIITAEQFASVAASDAPLLYRALFAAPPAGADMEPALHLLDHGLDAV